uniref:hypothetical protein n=1 Tax=Flavobacterium sp. TaxID=239 RepID=UPI00404ADA35
MTIQKKTIVSLFGEKLQLQITQISTHIENLSLEAKENAKSSAGDKHETDLAMMHLEQEKLSHKLRQLLHDQQIWNQLDFESKTKTVKAGNIVVTENFIFLIAVALPQIKFENQIVMSISPQSPLGNLLIGKQVNETIILNNNTYQIIEIL